MHIPLAKRHHIYLLLGSTLLPNLMKASPDIFNIQLETFWQNIEGRKTNDEKFGGHWILAGGITFKKKSNDTVAMDTLRLAWKGPKVGHLFASLYRKEIGRPFRAIEDNLVCDGVWRPRDQSLTFTFNTHEHIGAINTFYLVLTVPNNLEPILKTGHFEIEKIDLPIQFQEHNKTKTLALNCTQGKNCPSVH